MSRTGHTEEEAKTKWCPLARAAEPQRYGSGDPMCPVAAVNRGSDALSDPSYTPNALCLASGCAAWRWQMEAIHGDDAGFVREYKRTEYGYCGAFGRP